MTTRTIAALPLLLGLLGAAYQNTGQNRPATGQRNALPLTSEEAVSDVHSINHLEIMMGRLAEQKGSVPRVRRYGQLLARDHQLTDQLVLALARDQHLTVSPAVASPADQAMMKKLQGFSGAAFDRQFLADMKQGHDQAIALLKAAQGQLTNGSTRDFLAKLVPILTQHRDLAQRLQGKA